MAAAASWIQSSHLGCIHHTVSSMLMACMAEHICDLGLTLLCHLVRQHGELCGNVFLDPHSTLESLPLTQRSPLYFSGVSHREVA
jgi:hypothetical protein